MRRMLKNEKAFTNRYLHIRRITPLRGWSALGLLLCGERLNQGFTRNPAAAVTLVHLAISLRVKAVNSAALLPAGS